MELVLNKHSSWMKEKNESMNQSVNRKLSTLRQAFLLWAPHEAWCWEVSSFTPQSVDPQILSPGASRAWRTPWQWCLHSEEMPGGSWVPGKILLGLGDAAYGPQGCIQSQMADAGEQLGDWGKGVRDLGEFQDTWEKNTQGKVWPKPLLFEIVRLFYFVDTDFCEINYLNYTVIYLFCKNKKSNVNTHKYIHIHLYLNIEKNISVFKTFQGPWAL